VLCATRPDLQNVLQSAPRLRPGARIQAMRRKSLQDKHLRDAAAR
jgi:hypothetical protein